MLKVWQINFKEKYTESILFAKLYQNLKNKNEKKKGWQSYNQIEHQKKIDFSAVLRRNS